MIMTDEPPTNTLNKPLNVRRNSRDISVFLGASNTAQGLGLSKGSPARITAGPGNGWVHKSGNKEQRDIPSFRGCEDEQDRSFSAATTPNSKSKCGDGRLRWCKSEEVFHVAEGMELKRLDGRTVLPILEGRLYFQAAGFEPSTKGNIVHYFTLEKGLHYEPFCADFGPFNLATTYRFGETLKAMLLNPKLSKSKLILYSKAAQVDVTNAIYLLGSFLCVHLDATPEEAWRPFSKIARCPTLPFRDCTWVSPSTFDLHVQDCWAGLVRAVKSGLYSAGEFNLEEYLYYDSPRHGDMQEVVRGKLFAFKGPTDQRVQIRPGLFSFLPSDYCQVFRYKGVRTVIRLNEPEYDRESLVAQGFEHHDLVFDDCTAPSDAVADRFLRIVEASAGALAVHCHAGLGRTGTLIALWLMKHRAFTCREAIAWLRICRPGSVIGPQQQYLQAQEGRLHDLGRRGVPGLGLEGDPESDETMLEEEEGRDEGSKELAEMVSRAMMERNGARAERAGTSGHSEIAVLGHDPSARRDVGGAREEPARHREGELQSPSTMRASSGNAGGSTGCCSNQDCQWESGYMSPDAEEPSPSPEDCGFEPPVTTKSAGPWEGCAPSDR